MLPVSLIIKTIESIVERDKRVANDHSITSAHLACAVYGLAGAKEDISPDRFLPYPSNLQKESSRVSKRTAQTFLRLLDQGKLSPEVVSASERFIDSIAAQT